MHKQSIQHRIGDRPYESLAVWDDQKTGKRPLLLLAPTFMGPSELEEAKAEALAALGYAVFIIDIFGAGVRPTNVEEAVSAMTKLNSDRASLVEMMQAALSEAQKLNVVNQSKIAAIGYCLGGKCVLDLARQGVKIAGVVTVHGLFDQPGIPTANTISAKVLACHGWDDPLALPAQVVAFAAEMTEKKADWQIHAYGNAQHGFTTSNRADMYNAVADRRSWQAIKSFLEELFI